MAAKPIWKDYLVDFGVHADTEFRIVESVTNSIIYQGHAYRRPGETHLYVKVNDICADWIAHTLPTLAQAYLTPANLPVTFYIDDVTWGYNVATVQFYGDWSYDEDFDYTVDGLGHPINGRIDSRQWIPFTAIGVNDITMVITFTDGTTQTVTVPLAIQADYNADYNADFAISLISTGSGTAFFDLSQWTDVDYITLNGTAVYKVVTDCAAYALYYINAYGGWDTFLVEGNAQISDALKHNDVAVEYDNSHGEARGVRDFVVELDRDFVFHTGYLYDSESLRMHHLLNSPDVYLWDFAAQKMVPLVLTGTATPYKTFNSNGRKMVDYTIQARLAKQMVRR